MSFLETEKSQFTETDLKQLIANIETTPDISKEDKENCERIWNESVFGLYLTNDELLERIKYKLNRLQKWDYTTQSYHKYGVPKEWKVSASCADMSQIVNCAGCGKELPYGDTYTSLEIHTKGGFGYGVCSECYAKEWERRRNNK